MAFLIQSREPAAPLLDPPSRHLPDRRAQLRRAEPDQDVPHQSGETIAPPASRCRWSAGWSRASRPCRSRSPTGGDRWSGSPAAIDFIGRPGARARHWHIVAATDTTALPVPLCRVPAVAAVTPSCSSGQRPLLDSDDGRASTPRAGPDAAARRADDGANGSRACFVYHGALTMRASHSHRAGRRRFPGSISAPREAMAASHPGLRTIEYGQPPDPDAAPREAWPIELHESRSTVDVPDFERLLVEIRNRDAGLTRVRRGQRRST